MKVLCDTHVLVWALLAPERLSPTVRDLLEDARVEVLVSPVTGFEVATKHRIGKLPGAALLVQDYRGHLERLAAESFPVRDEHALWAGSLPWSHQDPFDRLLAAQAMLEHVPLVTADQVFAGLPGLSTIW